jgi:hypothetical protein
MDKSKLSEEQKAGINEAFIELVHRLNEINKKNGKNEIIHCTVVFTKCSMNDEGEILINSNITSTAGDVETCRFFLDRGLYTLRQTTSESVKIYL